MKKILITTRPFGQFDQTPLNMLRDAGFQIELCPEDRKFTAEELREQLKDTYGVIAGTEKLDASVLDEASELKIIARVGIGVDSVDFNYTNQNDITVTYTPDAPSRSVAELTMGLMLSLVRHVCPAHNKIAGGAWKRLTGQLLYGKTLGLLGYGRIGKLVAPMAQAFGMNVMACDLDSTIKGSAGVSMVDFKTLLSSCDVLSLHIPNNSKNAGLIGACELASMKKGSFIVNTARGGIVCEDALLKSLQDSHLAGCALDVFANEPYNLEQNEALANLDNVIMTAHMGSCTRKGRELMEVGAATSIVEFAKGIEPVNVIRSAE